MGNISHITHKKSNKLDGPRGIAKKPSTNDLEYGEIAVNYKKGYETLFIKNDTDNIVGFVNEDKHNSLKETVNSNYREFETEQGKVRTNTQDIETLKSSVSELSVVKTQISDITTKINNLGSIEEVTKSDLSIKIESNDLCVNCVYKITDYGYFSNSKKILYVRALTSNEICDDAILLCKIKRTGGYGYIKYYCRIVFNKEPKIIWAIDNGNNQFYFDPLKYDITVYGENNVIYPGCSNIKIRGDNNIIYHNCTDIKCEEYNSRLNNSTIYNNCNAINFKSNNSEIIIGTSSSNLTFENSLRIKLNNYVRNSEFINCNNVNINSGERINIATGCNNITMLGWCESIYLKDECSGNIFQGDNNNISLEKGCKGNVFSPGVNYITTSVGERSYNFIYPGVSQKELTDSHKIIGMMRDDPS